MLILYWQECWSAQANLGEDALAMLGLSECDETEAGRGVSHECFEVLSGT